MRVRPTYTGLKLEGQYKVSVNFSIDGSFGYLDIKIKKFPGSDVTNTQRNIAGLLTGAGYAPKYTASIADGVTVTLSGDTSLTERLGYNYTSKYQCVPEHAYGAILKDDGRRCA
jgi:iron complex outermembrane recepter protein